MLYCQIFSFSIDVYSGLFVTCLFFFFLKFLPVIVGLVKSKPQKCEYFIVCADALCALLGPFPLC